VNSDTQPSLQAEFVRPNFESETLEALNTQQGGDTFFFRMLACSKTEEVAKQSRKGKELEKY